MAYEPRQYTESDAVKKFRENMEKQAAYQSQWQPQIQSTMDSILNRITRNRQEGKQTFIFIDEFYILFQHEYSGQFLATLWKRVRKYGAYCTGITQNLEEVLRSQTARLMLSNSEFVIMMNQAPTDRQELAKLLHISERQLSYITNVPEGHGLLKVGHTMVPFENHFPKNTELYRLMTTKPNERNV